jgi:hypothetical protein
MNFSLFFVHSTWINVALPSGIAILFLRAQTEVMSAENDLTRAEGNRVTAILDYNRALANLQRSVTSKGSL